MVSLSGKKLTENPSGLPIIRIPILCQTSTCGPEKIRGNLPSVHFPLIFLCLPIFGENNFRSIFEMSRKGKFASNKNLLIELVVVNLFWSKWKLLIA